MKRIELLLVILASCCLITTGCKEQADSGSIEKKVFITSGKGAAVKKSPDTNSESMGIIPFGTEVAVNEIITTGETANGWLKTKWNTGEGWIRNDVTGSE